MNSVSFSKTRLYRSKRVVIDSLDEVVKRKLSSNMADNNIKLGILYHSRVIFQPTDMNFHGPN